MFNFPSNPMTGTEPGPPECEILTKQWPVGYDLTLAFRQHCYLYRFPPIMEKIAGMTVVRSGHFEPSARKSFIFNLQDILNLQHVSPLLVIVFIEIALK